MSLNVSFFTGYGKVGDYARTQTMKRKWHNRKSTGDFSSKETSTVKYDTRSTSDIIRDKLQDEARKIMDSYEELQKKDDDSGSRMTEIRNKYMAGGKLSADEMEYVSQKDPKFYQEIKAEEQELKSFEKRLRAAKTKEEAQRVIEEEAHTALSKVNAVTNNPHISEGDKMAVCVAEYRKLVKKQEIFDKFAEKGEYHRLPTEAEKQKAEKEIQEAKEEALKESSETPCKDRSSEDSEKQDTDYHEALTERHTDIRREEHESRPETLNKNTAQKQAKSIVEAENSPEARKTKRAKQSHGYGKLYDDSPEGTSSHVWDA